MSSVNDGFEEVRGGLLLLELSMCCCMSMPHSQKAEATLLLLEEAEVMHIRRQLLGTRRLLFLEVSMCCCLSKPHSKKQRLRCCSLRRPR